MYIIQNDNVFVIMKHYKGEEKSEVVAVCSSRRKAAVIMKQLKNNPYRRRDSCYYLSEEWKLDDCRFELLLGRLKKSHG